MVNTASLLSLLIEKELSYVFKVRQSIFAVQRKTIFINFGICQQDSQIPGMFYANPRNYVFNGDHKYTYEYILLFITLKHTSYNMCIETTTKVC